MFLSRVERPFGDGLSGVRLPVSPLPGDRRSCCGPAEGERDGGLESTAGLLAWRREALLGLKRSRKDKEYCVGMDFNVRALVSLFS